MMKTRAGRILSAANAILSEEDAADVYKKKDRDEEPDRENDKKSDNRKDKSSKGDRSNKKEKPDNVGDEKS